MSAEPRPDPRGVSTAARAAVAELDAVLDGVQGAVLEPLSKRERATLVRLLHELG